MDYFISDTHFNHENILKYERTEFSHIEDHNKFILELLQKTLTKNDTLYHLGDFGTVTKEIISEWNKIPGKKIIILGNHDKQSSKLEDLFDEIHKEPIFYTKRILLSHEPLPVTEETLNIHGHLHGSKLNKPNYFNISFAVNNYKLTTEKEVRNILHNIPKISWKFLEEWYAEDYLFTIDNEAVVLKENSNNLIDLDKSKEKLNEVNFLKSFDRALTFVKSNTFPFQIKEIIIYNIDDFLKYFKKKDKRFFYNKKETSIDYSYLGNHIQRKGVIK